MSRFTDTPIPEGTRKKATYSNKEKGQLMLGIERTDGGKLKIPLLSDVLTSKEKDKYQQNTLLAITPLARLPGHDGPNDSLQGALPRPGRIYVFFRNKLWRELQTDGQGRLLEINVAHWRKMAERKRKADRRPPVCVEQYSLLVPMFLHGRFVGDQLSMAYSELPWTWAYIDWLEQQPQRISERSQNLATAWTAAAAEAAQHWKATTVYPMTRLAELDKGLRARELHVETLLQDPALFTPDLQALPATDIASQLEHYQQALAGHLNVPAPPPLDALPAAQDLLNEQQIAKHPQLVGVILDDPLFALRHAVVQSRLAAELLQTLNALVPHQPHGPYAELVYQQVLAPGGSLVDLRPNIDQERLKNTLFHSERRNARKVIELQQQRLLDLAKRRLPAVWNDYLHSNDERLLEPYALLVELLEGLNRTAQQADPRCIEPEDATLSKAVLKLSQELAAATHALTKELLPPPHGELPPAASKLAALYLSNTEPDPELLGLSSLSVFSKLYVGQNLALAVDELITHLAYATATAARRAARSQQVTQVQMLRVFGPSFTLANKVIPKARNLQLITQGQALEKNLVVLGVHGGGLSFGLTPEERTTLTRKNFLAANLRGDDGQLLGTTSSKIAERLNFAKKDLGSVMVVAGPANDPMVEDYLRWRKAMPTMAAAGSLSTSTVLPGLATVFAGFSLYANSVGTLSLWTTEPGRVATGFFAAVLDLGLAANNVALKILAESKTTRSPWLTFWEKGRFDTRNWKGNFAENLLKRTGSTWLNWSRIGSVVALTATSALFVWDATKAFRQGEERVALAFSLAAAGSAMWALYTFGLFASPWILGIGLVLLAGGVIGAALLGNSPAEQAIRRGPFGDGERLKHLDDPLIAYHQLIGALGAPQFKIARLQQWQRQVSTADNQLLEAVAQDNKITLNPMDWAVELQCPLLAHFENGQTFRIRAREIGRVRQNFTGWEYHRVEIDKAVLSDIALDGTRILYVLRHKYDVDQYDLNPYLQTREYSLRVYGQFAMGQLQCRADDLFPHYRTIRIPQPAPNAWVAFPGPQPEDHSGAGDVPWWLIEQREFLKQ